MFRDSKYDHPADPYLMEALKRSTVMMRDGYYDLAKIMEGQRAIHGDMPEGTPLTIDGVELDYMSPDIALRTGNFIDEVGDSLQEHLARANTLEAQREILLLGIRDMLVSATFDDIHPKQATAVISSIQELFNVYSETDQPMSRELLNVRNDIHYYSRIGFDGLDAVDGLMRQLQDEQGIDPSRQMATPGALAWRLRMQTNPARTDQRSFHDTRDLCEDACPIFTAMLEPYEDVLPTDVGVDMLGLVLRTAEQVGDQEIRTHAPGKLRAANDDAPANTQALLMHPLVKMRTRAILNTVFQKYPEAALTPQGIMDASLEIEELLAKEASRNEQRGR